MLFSSLILSRSTHLLPTVWPGRVTRYLSAFTQVILEHRVQTKPTYDDDDDDDDEWTCLPSKPPGTPSTDPTVSIITLDRPKANAMSKQMLHELKEQLKLVDHARCVILTSSSDRVFSAGADLKERKSMSPSEAEAFVADLRQCFHDVSQLPMPVIAAVEGAALGGGLELALAADFRIVSKAATLGLPETSLAIVPGAGGTQRLPRLVGTARAKELIFTAARLSGEEAASFGLVDHLTEPGQTMEKALEIAWRIAQNGPVAVRAAKEAIDRGLFAPSMQEALDIEKECYSRVLSTQDRLEGLAAFQEGRMPIYKGH